VWVYVSLCRSCEFCVFVLPVLFARRGYVRVCVCVCVYSCLCLCVSVYLFVGVSVVCVACRCVWVPAQRSEVALALHEAGIAMQGGTVPVERLWASLTFMWPAAGRVLSPRWFWLLALLGFLRYNYRHAHATLLPTWTEGDWLMAERMENIVAAVTAFEQDDSGDFQTLFQPFR
jgi:hypothetical protein